MSMTSSSCCKSHSINAILPIMKKPIAFIYLSLCLLAFVSCQNDYDAYDSDIKMARSYFQSKASSLAIPYIAAPASTKSVISGNSQYPDWDNAEIVLNGTNKTIQVPLCGPIKIVGGVAHVHNGEISRLKTNTRSFLVLQYEGDNPSPEMFIATVLICGNGVQQADYISSRSILNGIVITSGLDGMTQSIVTYEKGQSLSIEADMVSQSSSKTLPENASGIIFKLAVAAPSTKGGDYGNNTEAGYNEIVCYRCGRTYYGYIWTECPDCGYCDYYNYLYCGNCLELLEDCICSGYKVCPYCGQLLGKTCNCQGGLYPETPDSGK